MDASIQGSLNQLDRCYRFFEHKGKSMTKKQVKSVLKYALNKGYKSTSELTDDEVDKVLKSISKSK